MQVVFLDKFIGSIWLGVEVQCRQCKSDMQNPPNLNEFPVFLTCISAQRCQAELLEYYKPGAYIRCPWSLVCIYFTITRAQFLKSSGDLKYKKTTVPIVINELRSVFSFFFQRLTPYRYTLKYNLLALATFIQKCDSFRQLTPTLFFWCNITHFLYYILWNKRNNKTEVTVKKSLTYEEKEALWRNWNVWKHLNWSNRRNGVFYFLFFNQVECLSFLYKTYSHTCSERFFKTGRNAKLCEETEHFWNIYYLIFFSTNVMCFYVLVVFNCMKF